MRGMRMRTMGTIAGSLALVAMLSACSEPTPQERQARQIEEQADAQADAVEAAAANEAATLEAQAADLINEAGPSGSFDARRLEVRAEALRDEADLIEEQAEARARAIRDAGTAKASAVRAQ